ncbi:Zn(2)-C6 fungal-type DNA-binding domain protein [Cordyceps fumosorosea ARSEF 2679]|uniref:Zn(2)-C6 fungal-type DNA-binding domain protein n=1 Tax=Cordyceps fumosorosea (strain ARSEF 2679) TaxID=1081104 RepID=A0A162JSP5_CORFA|nr:Zn(2)-C6 fungal-type DNA-binding domain protein [Cordyceps fumosorosea ARSEF 2679]OAA73172.1 Zn(2)-C6 fungal-type DNA-binding domain protein [Cordyceps fumosorosea ARSEF 2679]
MEDSGDSPTSSGTPGTVAATTTAGPPSGSPARTVEADGPADKKLRACEACRGLKVRCEPDPREGEPCRRCKKAGRGCVVTAPTRKRQRKTDSRVSELERKIDALTASLQARTGGGGDAVRQQHGNVSGSSGSNRGQEHKSWDSEVAPWDSARPADQDSHFQQLVTMAGRKRKAMDEGISKEGGSRPAAESESAATAADNDDRKPSAAAAAVGWPAYTSRSTDGDVVDRGLVPPALAARLFTRYKTQMVRHLPGVVFAPSATVAELRSSRPTLFLAIMAAAAGEDHALQRVLQRELMRTLARRVMEVGEKSLELVQALNVAVIWYWPPEHFEELKFYQLIHTAAVMAIDIGLGRRPPRGGKSRAVPQAGYYPAWRGGRSPPPDPTSLEARRTWLTCYYLASNTAMSLRRPNLVRWTGFMADSVRVLETSAEAAPTDAYLCHLVWTHRLGEQVGAQLSLDDPDAAAAVDVEDARTQYALRALERDLERYRAAVPPARMQATLKIGFDLLSLYMHETVLHGGDGGGGEEGEEEGEEEEEGLVGRERAARPLSAQHVNALTACLAAIDGIFATFLALDVESIRCLPVFNFVRVAYAVVVLMKMHFSVTAAAAAAAAAGGEAGSDLAVVFPREALRVRQHLDALLDKFRETAAGDRCRPASKFLVVLAMLRSWFVKQDGSGSGEAPASAAAQQRPRQQQQQQQQQRYQQQPQTTANTPLELLSEVAVGSDPSNPASSSSPFGYYRPTPPPAATAAPPPQQVFFPDANPATTTSPGGGGTTTPFTTAASSGAAFPAWMMPDSGGGGFDAAAGMLAGGEFPTAVEFGAIGGMGFGFDGGVGGVAGMNATTNDQFWTDMFQGIPDPNMFTF